MNDNRVQTNSPGFRLIPETATFLDLCIVACCGWIFIRLAAKIKGGATKELDETILRMLRHEDNLAIPRGPKWLSHASHDITSLGSGTNLTLASGIAVGFLCLQRRLSRRGVSSRVPWQRTNAELFAEEFLPSGAADGGSPFDAFRSRQLSQRPFNGRGTGLSDIGWHHFQADSAAAEQGLFPIRCACALGVSRYQQNLPGRPLSE